MKALAWTLGAGAFALAMQISHAPSDPTQDTHIGPPAKPIPTVTVTQVPIVPPALRPQKQPKQDFRHPDEPPTGGVTNPNIPGVTGWKERLV